MGARNNPAATRKRCREGGWFADPDTEPMWMKRPLDAMDTNFKRVSVILPIEGILHS